MLDEAIVEEFKASLWVVSLSNPTTSATMTLVSYGMP